MPWAPDAADWSSAPDGTPGPSWYTCLRAAIAAPSVYNSQPWRFRIDPDGVEVYADRRRLLGVIDPRGRELMISVGAAVFNLRVAILAEGRRPLVWLLPRPAEPDLVARIELGAEVEPDETVRALARAIPLRHTNRQPFADIPLPPEVVADLTAAARVEGVGLAMADQMGTEAVLGLVRRADVQLRAQPGYRAELARWTPDEPGARDGVPPEAIGPWSAPERLPLRDFGLSLPGDARPVGRFEEHPVVAALYTREDGPNQWLRAGQGLQRVLLTATVRGVASTLMTQPLEVADLRRLLADPRDGRIVPQAIIRLGYGPPTLATPRRPIADVLMPVRAPAPANAARRARR